MIAASDKDTLVISDTVIVDQTVSTNGRDITIICRQLTFLPASEINTSGRNGEPNYQTGVMPPIDPARGLSGTDGRNGGDGSHAGNIHIISEQIEGKITIKALGGSGGRAEDGGNGQNGIRGKDGEFAWVSSMDELPYQSIGGDGGKGGDVGLPGYRGKPGQGGSVTIELLSEQVLDEIDVDLRPGSAGAVGTRGAQGKGGDPGLGGLLWESESGRGGSWWAAISHRGASPIFPAWDVNGSMEGSQEAIPPEQSGLAAIELTERAYAGALDASLELFLWREAPHNPYGGSKFAPDGNRGADGNLRDAEFQARLVDAVAAAGTTAVTRATPARFAESFDDLTVELILFALEEDFRVSAGTASDEFRAKLRSVLVITQNAQTTTDRRKNSLSRALSISTKLNLGLDYFGYRPEQVPLMSFETYSNLIDRIVIPNADRVERSYREYWQKLSAKQELLTSVSAATEATESGLLGLNLEISRLSDDALIMIRDIAALEKRLEAAATMLVLFESALTKAIKAKNANCDAMGVISSAIMIVGGVSTGGAGIIGAAKAVGELFADISAFNESFSKLWEVKNIIGNDLKRVGDNAKSSVEAINAISQAVAGLPGGDRKLPQFVVEKSKLDDIAKELADFAEASAYRNAGYEYLAAVEARNNAIINYNAVLMQVAILNVKRREHTDALDKLGGVIKGQYDPAEPIIMTSISRIYLNTLDLAAQMVHSEKKGLSYHFGKQAAVRVSALNVASIIEEHNIATIRDWSAAKERYRARRELTSGLLEIDIAELVDASAWSAFKKYGSVGFVIRRLHPLYFPVLEALPGLRITGLSLEIPGAQVAKGQSQIPWTIVHGGSELVYDADGRETQFTHRTVKFSGFTAVSGAESIIKSDFSENNLYSGVSPFASWVLSFSKNEALRLDLSRITAARLVVSGYIIEG